MKKISVFAIAALFVLCAISTSVFAEDVVYEDILRIPIPPGDETYVAIFNPADSRYIDDETKQKLGILIPSGEPNATEYVKNESVKQYFKVYNVSLLFAFTESGNIEDVLSSRNVLETYYLISGTSDFKVPDLNSFIFEDQRGPFVKVCFRDDGVYEQPYALNPRAVTEFLENKQIKVIADDISVKEVYYLDGENSRYGTAIYYVTDYGDYVYYNWLNKEYLLPAKEYYAYWHTVLDELAKHPDWDDGMPVVDLSPYDLNSETFSVQPTVIPIKAEVSADVLAPAVETPNEIAPAATEDSRALVIAVVLTAALVALAATVVFTQYRKKKIG